MRGKPHLLPIQKISNTQSFSLITCISTISLYSFAKSYRIRLISAPLLYSAQSCRTLLVGSIISSLTAIRRVFPSISCPSCNRGRSTTRAFLFLGQYDYYSTYPSNKLYLWGSFLLASQGYLIRVLDGCRIGPRTLSYCLGFLALTLLTFSLSKVSLKARSALYYYRSTYASGDPLGSYRKRPSSLPLPQRLEPLVRNQYIQ